ncbi:MULTISPECIES: CRISPR-associated endonuclease Cas2 [Virgibacillus]|uniref:CRISPR-associated endonuclease Cas2 n=1 Tax=Virgibacillus TaxID=84406 RepID=UPI00090AB740|nr:MULTISPECIES: CRISPR-associated endonuclease Cas2 [Virgibacillus]API92068.1 CRISPR-associated endonuclease Cas2 [Virgibacillus sp. 6R]MBS7430537.1 CRISPR-associated endonuclease Cas2 [Virgibacillus sp. 19R1-5]MBU8566475.1 CRISPR-associated endonuclease Cas2 [Virgibacillus pantothenticus]MBU8600110.1 CRISPR-associated endonuclease Cas2 [Virgibacillus pantothenticus]MBU8633958.1 CRISPR-associated endonuclease Cas2 [Virgibacillus pantothenticus]
MLVLVTYDVNTSSNGGRKRLRKVSKVCQNYGQRVQNSVFECIVDDAQFAALKIQLTGLIDEEKDSLRFYRLGNNYKTKVEHIGTKEAINLEDPLIF